MKTKCPTNQEVYDAYCVLENRFGYDIRRIQGRMRRVFKKTDSNTPLREVMQESVKLEHLKQERAHISFVKGFYKKD